MTRGLVIGKFYPPHAGHSYLIDTALAGSDSLDVLICDSPEYHIPAELRAGWLRKLHPDANVRIIPDLGDDDNSEAWAKHTVDFLGYAPDVVFSSEDYGVMYSKLMGAVHKMVDRARRTYPISGTKVRSDVEAAWELIHRPIRQHFAHRICVIGAESTGTTTLAKALAKHYKTFWVPEYGRLYSESKLTAGRVSWTSQEFEHIAEVQQEIEDELAGECAGLVICDTNAFATRVWHKRYMGDYLQSLEKYVNCPCDLYIVTSPDIPFEQDGTRDGEHIRHEMHQWFLEQLEKHELPYIVVNGSRRKRLMASVQEIGKITERKITI